MRIEAGCEYESKPAGLALAPVRRVLSVNGDMVRYEVVGGLKDKLEGECGIEDFRSRVSRKLIAVGEVA